MLLKNYKIKVLVLLSKAIKLYQSYANKLLTNYIIKILPVLSKIKVELYWIRL